MFFVDGFMFSIDQLSLGVVQQLEHFSLPYGPSAISSLIVQRLLETRFPRRLFFPSTTFLKRCQDQNVFVSASHSVIAPTPSTSSVFSRANPMRTV